MSLVMPVPTAANAEEMLGEMRALASTLGQPDAADLALSRSNSGPCELTTVVAWRQFVGGGFREALTAYEWPLIVRAHGFAQLGQARELVTLDQAWGQTRATLPAFLPSLGEASCRLGQRQLNRLRPLRDHRVVQRYLAAIEAGEARGWHPLVYGVVLSVFAIPLRQGVLHYGRQAAAGFLAGTPLAAHLVETARNELIDEAEDGLRVRLKQLLPETPLVTV